MATVKCHDKAYISPIASLLLEFENITAHCCMHVCVACMNALLMADVAHVSVYVNNMTNK